jgi:hypothetical protein
MKLSHLPCYNILQRAWNYLTYHATTYSREHEIISPTMLQHNPESMKLSHLPCYNIIQRAWNYLTYHATAYSREHEIIEISLSASHCRAQSSDYYCCSFVACLTPSHVTITHKERTEHDTCTNKAEHDTCTNKAFSQWRLKFVVYRVQRSMCGPHFVWDPSGVQLSDPLGYSEQIP